MKLRSSLDIQFLELHREYLLLKQESCSIRVWNLLTNSSKKISRTRDFHPKAFIFFDQIAEISNFTHFLTVSTNEINVWTCSNFGEVEIKFRISLPGIQTADCVNVCYNKGIIMTYCNGLVLQDGEDDEASMLEICGCYDNSENSNDMNRFIPQFIQASKYFTSLCGANEVSNPLVISGSSSTSGSSSNNSSNNISSNSSNSSNISLSTIVTGETLSESEQELARGNYNPAEDHSIGISQSRESALEFDTSSYMYQQDGILAPFRPMLEEDAGFSRNKSYLKKAIYIHSLYDGSSLGTVFCDDIRDESEDVVLLHYDSEGMEIACGTNFGLLRRYKHVFG